MGTFSNHRGMLLDGMAQSNLGSDTLYSSAVSLNRLLSAIPTDIIGAVFRWLTKFVGRKTAKSVPQKTADLLKVPITSKAIIYIDKVQDINGYYPVCIDKKMRIAKPQ